MKRLQVLEQAGAVPVLHSCDLNTNQVAYLRFPEFLVSHGGGINFSLSRWKIQQHDLERATFINQIPVSDSERRHNKRQARLADVMRKAYERYRLSTPYAGLITDYRDVEQQTSLSLG